MSLSLLMLLAMSIFVAAYWIYGKRVGRWLSLSDDDKTPTPAVQFNDGVDFVPTRRPILLAQHFASIAAAGPIVGPIAAGLTFGWAPTLLWILFGCTLIGACHDLGSLVASVKHGAKSLPEIAKAQMGPAAYRLSLGFVWLCLLYVVIAFTDVTAQQFIAKEEWGGNLHEIGGGVATSSILYLFASILMGVLLTKFKFPLSAATILFIPILGAIIYFGQYYPIVIPAENPVMIWGILILAYCAVASLLPMWLLLQPRGYLGGYFLYVILAVGLLGLFFGGFETKYPAFKGFVSGNGVSLFPFLFITVACGACSGFHGLVCSGTTSKQLEKESHSPLIGYGGMLLEGVVAVVALSTVMIWAPGDATLLKSPSEIYATGIARFAHSVLGISPEWGLAFGMLAFATFVYDTLDCATRLGRYLMEELTQMKGWGGRFLATALTLGFPLIYVLFSPRITQGEKTVPLWQAIWPLFGSSNQLLAALTLLLLSVWQAKSGRAWKWLLVPALFMFGTTGTALIIQLSQATRGSFSVLSGLNALVSIALLLVAGGFGFLVVKGVKKEKGASLLSG